MSKENNTKNSAGNNSTGAFGVNWDIEKYRDEHECEEHWQLRKAFMEKWKKNFPEERLICLARVYTNIEFMGCRYPAPVMQQIAQLSFEVGQKYKDKKKTKLQRTFVSASTAAEDRARGIKRVGGEIVADEKPKSTRIAFVSQGEIPAPAEDENVSDEEGMKLVERGASSTFLASGGPAANALSPSVGTGMVVAKTAAETKTQPFCKQRMLALIGASTEPSSHTQVKTTASLSLTTQTAALGNSGARVPLTHPPSSTAPQANLSELAVTGQKGVGNFAEDAFVLAWQVQKHKGKGKCTPQVTNYPSDPSTLAERDEKRYRTKRSQNQCLKVRRKLLQAEAGITRPECSGQPAQPTAATAAHAQSGSATLNVAVTCARTGILSKDVSGQVLSAIQV